jgi:para-nitrobenzyl esterase
MLKILQLGVAVLVACTRTYALSPTVVLGDIGTVVGVTNSTSGLDTFQGIPYAKPPLGALRWRLPQPLPPDPSRVIQATTWGPACLQVPVGKPVCSIFLFTSFGGNV